MDTEIYQQRLARYVTAMRNEWPDMENERRRNARRRGGSHKLSS